MKYFEIKKKYRNACETVYIRLEDNEELTEAMLESIGSEIPGGENYGWRIDATEIEKLPEKAKVLPRTIRQRIY